MYVYFLKTVSTGQKGSTYRYKIGHASDVAKRISHLQTGCPTTIHLFGTIKCLSKKHAMDVERSLHEYFTQQRRIGEWFQFSGKHAWMIRLLIRDWPINNDICNYLKSVEKQAVAIKDALYIAKLPTWTGLGPIDNLDRNEFIDRIRHIATVGNYHRH